MKVALVDDSAAIRQSFGALLATAPGVEVVGCADDMATAIALIASSRPDLIVLDARLSGPDRGIDVLRHVRKHHPEIKVIIFSQSNSPSLEQRLMQAGAFAYFDKGTEFQQARDSIAMLSAASSEQRGRGRP